MSEDPRGILADRLDVLIGDDRNRAFYALKAIREILRRQNLELRCTVHGAAAELTRPKEVKT